jgi:hypothetical protein
MEHLALVSYFGSGKSDNVAQAISSYIQMTIANNKSIEAIGNLCVKWCWKPDEESLHELAELRGVLLTYAEN